MKTYIEVVYRLTFDEVNTIEGGVTQELKNMTDDVTMYQGANATVGQTQMPPELWQRCMTAIEKHNDVSLNKPAAS